MLLLLRLRRGNKLAFRLAASPAITTLFCTYVCPCSLELRSNKHAPIQCFNCCPLVLYQRPLWLRMLFSVNPAADNLRSWKHNELWGIRDDMFTLLELSRQLMAVHNRNASILSFCCCLISVEGSMMVYFNQRHVGDLLLCWFAFTSQKIDKIKTRFHYVIILGIVSFDAFISWKLLGKL